MKIRPSFRPTLLVLAIPLAVLLCLRDSDSAQQPSTTQPMSNLKVQAREVLLPVTVIDKKGALVTDLTAKDFTLTEDGRPQVIKSFTAGSNLPFKLGLLVDTSRSVYSAMDTERKAAEKFVDQMLPADPKAGVPGDGSTSQGSKADTRGDEAFLIHFDREVELLEDFTNSRDKLDHEIDAMKPTSREQDSQGPETTGDDRGYGSDTQHGGGTQLYDAIYLSSNELMMHKTGRKALIVFSDGVDRGSKETLNDAVDAADRAGVEVFTIYFKGEEERQGGFPGHHGGMGGGYPGGGYPGGGGGWPGGGGHHPGGTNAPQLDGKKMMQDIASRTGGMFFEAKKKDSLDEIYGLIAGALDKQYLLTYTPDKVDDDGDFHKIVLKTDKPDLTVVTREGYYGGNGKDSDAGQ
ncbi:MAG TPA: VWA domain-containing protein [Terracidiphilus sp.]|nr:VWA domain-containing protein [Terracidiphilus sp.]